MKHAVMDEEMENNKNVTEYCFIKDSTVKINFVKKVQANIRNITYEPVMLLYQVCYMITIATSQNVMLEKACRVDLDLGDEICSALRQQNDTQKYHYHEQVLQIYVAPSVNLRAYVITGIPCLLLPLVGFYSDRTGYRKIVPIIQITAQILVCLNNLVHVYFITETGLYFFVTAEALLEALGGGFACIYMTVLSYMCTVTSVRERTFRIGLLYISQSIAIPVGLSIVGPLLKLYGYYWCYSVSGVLNFFNLLYNVFWIKDAKRSTEQKLHDGRGALYFMRTFFDLSNVKETVRVVFKNGPNKRRLRMCVLLSIVSILFGPVYGELSILYMSTRYRFGWDELKFSMFQTYNFVTHTLGTVFSLLVFSKKLQWHDSVLGIISTLSKIVASFVYCFAITPQVFYLAPVVEILNGTALLAMRSIISKFVGSDELGKVNSIFGLTENLMPLIYVPLYTTVYAATMEVLPGAVFLMGATMTIPAVVVFFWLFYEHRKGVRRIQKDTSNEAATPLNGAVEIPLK